MLSVIIILAIIALIVVPTILNLIENSKKQVFKLDVESIINATNLYLIENSFMEDRIFDLSKEEDKKILGIKNQELTGFIKVVDEEVKSIFIRNKYDCLYGSVDHLIQNLCSNIEITEPEVSVIQKKVENKIEIIIDTYDTTDVSYIELPNGEVVDVESDLKNRLDNSIKILVVRDVENKIQPILKKFFYQVDYAPDMEISEILKNNYNIVVDESAYGRTLNETRLNQLYQQGVHLYTAGNDNDSALNIVNSFKISSGASYNAFKTVTNEVTSKIDNTIFTTTDSQRFIQFIPGVEAWYQGQYEGITYDVLGYLRNENNARWIHNQVGSRYAKFNDETYRRIMYRLSAKKSVNYIVNASSDYQFKVVDVYGNSKTINVAVTV